MEEWQSGLLRLTRNQKAGLLKISSVGSNPTSSSLSCYCWQSGLKQSESSDDPPERVGSTGSTPVQFQDFLYNRRSGSIGTAVFC